ncbi:MAG: YggS family pyridoxal phosphate-dependent enzyme [bacterium]
MSLQENLNQVEKRITTACLRTGRQREEVTLVAVTKTQPVEILQGAYDLGIRDFGENKVQELLAKKELLPPDIRWHLIGHLQSNKAKSIAPFIHSVHSIDSLGVAVELSNRATRYSRAIDVLLEINVAGEATKEGVAIEEAENLLYAIREQATALSVRGLMTVAPFLSEADEVRPVFQKLRNLANNLELHDLSMGMTNDFEVAIEEGATIIRIGSALFGKRQKNNS